MFVCKLPLKLGNSSSKKILYIKTDHRSISAICCFTKLPPFVFNYLTFKNDLNWKKILTSTSTFPSIKVSYKTAILQNCLYNWLVIHSNLGSKKTLCLQNCLLKCLVVLQNCLLRIKLSFKTESKIGLRFKVTKGQRKVFALTISAQRI